MSTHVCKTAWKPSRLVTFLMNFAAYYMYWQALCQMRQLIVPSDGECLWEQASFSPSDKFNSLYNFKNTSNNLQLCLHVCSACAEEISAPILTGERDTSVIHSVRWRERIKCQCYKTTHTCFGHIELPGLNVSGRMWRQITGQTFASLHAAAHAETNTAT